MTNVGQVLSQNVTEPLTVIDAKNGTPQPKLATEWERVDDTTWRFNLRDGVKFQDGTDFNAEAVAFSIKRMTGGAFTCNNIAKFGSAKLTVTPVDNLTRRYQDGEAGTDPAGAAERRDDGLAQHSGRQGRQRSCRHRPL